MLVHTAVEVFVSVLQATMHANTQDWLHVAAQGEWKVHQLDHGDIMNFNQDTDTQ